MILFDFLFRIAVTIPKVTIVNTVPKVIEEMQRVEQHTIAQVVIHTKKITNVR